MTSKLRGGRESSPAPELHTSLSLGHLPEPYSFQLGHNPVDGSESPGCLFSCFSLIYRKLWEDPSEFRPERFLTADGTINKVLSEKVILFGLGKRKCIGETIARLEVFLFLAILLHQVEFHVTPGVKVDMTPLYGLTMKYTRCEHFQVHMRP